MPADGSPHTFTADIVVLSAGAILLAALLLKSANDRHPHGLANSSDQVGRNYLRHDNLALIAFSREPNPTVFQKTLALNDFYGPGEGWPYPMGDIQMLGKSDDWQIKGAAPRGLGWAPSAPYGEVARHSIDFWLSSEDLPLARQPDHAAAGRHDPAGAATRQQHPRPHPPAPGPPGHAGQARHAGHDVRPQPYLHKKIAINGAGIAGPALAYWFHRNGHEVVLIEKAPLFRTGGYVIDFWGVGYTVAERMASYPRCERLDIPFVNYVSSTDAVKRWADFLWTRSPNDPRDRFTSLPLCVLGPPPTRHQGKRRDYVQQHYFGPRRVLNQGVRHFRARCCPRFRSRHCADGLHSTVRALAFGPESQFEKPLGYHVAAFEVEADQPRDELVYVCYSEPGLRGSVHFALRGDRTVFVLFSSASR